MRDAGDPFETTYRLLAGGKAHAAGKHQRGNRGDDEDGQQASVRRLGQIGPKPRERDEQERPGDAATSHRRGHRRSSISVQRLASTLRANLASSGELGTFGSAMGHDTGIGMAGLGAVGSQAH